VFCVPRAVDIGGPAALWAAAMHAGEKPCVHRLTFRTRGAQQRFSTARRRARAFISRTFMHVDEHSTTRYRLLITQFEGEMSTMISRAEKHPQRRTRRSADPMKGLTAADAAPTQTTDDTPETYPAFLADLKQRIKSARLQASLSVNRELVRLYWNIGREILARQQNEGWGRR
jgi:hypothetical protein